MPWYKCSIEGKNFPGGLVGKSNPVGFFATRFVQAASPEEGELLSLAELRRDVRFEVPTVGSQEADARIFYDEIQEIEQSLVPPVIPGLVWYEMGT